MSNGYVHRTIETSLDEMYGNFPSILITGSQIFETMENITESLVGIIDLYPLSTREICNLHEEIFIIPDINIKKNKLPLKYEYINNINATDISKDVSVDSETIAKWTSVLSNTYIIFLLQPQW